MGIYERKIAHFLDIYTLRRIKWEMIMYTNIDVASDCVPVQFVLLFDSCNAWFNIATDSIDIDVLPEDWFPAFSAMAALWDFAEC